LREPALEIRAQRRSGRDRRDRARLRLRGLGITPGGRVRGAEGVEHGGLGVAARGALREVDGFLRCAQRRVGRGGEEPREIVGDLHPLRVDAQRLAVARDRGRQVLRPLRREPERPVDLRGVGPARERALELGARLGDATLVDAHESEIRARVSETGIDLQSGVERLLGARRIAAHAIGPAEERVRGGVVTRHGGGVREQRRAVAPGLHLPVRGDREREHRDCAGGRDRAA